MHYGNVVAVQRERRLTKSISQNWIGYIWQINLIQQKHSHLSENQKEGRTEEHGQFITQVIFFYFCCISPESEGLSCHDFTLHGWLVEAVPGRCWSLLHYILGYCSFLIDSSYFLFPVWKTPLKSWKIICSKIWMEALREYFNTKI